MSDEQTTSELVSDLFIWAKALEEHHSTYTLAKTARTAADRLEALQARVDALEAEVRQTASSNLSVRTKALTETAKILSKRNDSIR